MLTSYVHASHTSHTSCWLPRLPSSLECPASPHPPSLRPSSPSLPFPLSSSQLFPRHGIDVTGVYAVLTAPDVDVDGFCASMCAQHDVSVVHFVWAGVPSSQVRGRSEREGV